MQRRIVAVVICCWGVLLCCNLVCGADTDKERAVLVSELRCEYLHDPLGIDARRPRLSWVLESDTRGVMQSAYQVVVASSPEKLAKDAGDLWDSGKVASSQSSRIRYAGKELSSGERVWWKVRVWDQAGTASAWSEVATWEMGLLSPDDWHGKWVSTLR